MPKMAPGFLFSEIGISSIRLILGSENNTSTIFELVYVTSFRYKNLLDSTEVLHCFTASLWPWNVQKQFFRVLNLRAIRILEPSAIMSEIMDRLKKISKKRKKLLAQTVGFSLYPFIHVNI